MTDQFHSMDALKDTFRDIKKHPGTVFFTAAILSSPTLIAATIANATSPMFGLPLQIVAGFFTSVWLPVAMIYAAHRFATGQDPGPRGVLDLSAGRRMFSYFGVVVLIFLLVAGVLFLFMLPALIVFIGAMSRTGGDIFRTLESGATGPLMIILLVIGVLAFLAVYFLIVMRYFFAGPIAVLEGRTAVESLRRSKKLAKGRWLDIFVMLLIFMGFGLVGSLVLGGPSILVSMGSGATSGPTGFRSFPFAPTPLDPVRAMIVGVSSFLQAAVIGPITGMATANLYLAVRGAEMLGEQRAAQGWPTQPPMQPMQPMQPMPPMQPMQPPPEVQGPATYGQPPPRYEPEQDAPSIGDDLRPGPGGHGQGDAGQQQSGPRDHPDPRDLPE